MPAFEKVFALLENVRWANGVIMPDIELVNVSKHICQNINLNINNKEIFVVVGTTGAGKTTLLNVIAGVTEHEGNVLFDGNNVDEVFREKICGLPVSGPCSFPAFDRGGKYCLWAQRRWFRKSAADKRVLTLMEMVRIKHLAHRYPHMLSGGEKTCCPCAFPRSCSANTPPDEPTSSLDHQTAKYLRGELVPLLKRLR